VRRAFHDGSGKRDGSGGGSDGCNRAEPVGCEHVERIERDATGGVRVSASADGAVGEILLRVACRRFGRVGGRGSWLTDAPEAEMHFLQGMKRLTRINAGEDSRGVGLGNDTLFDFPFLYAVEVGRWYLSEADAARLREYLLRGGFLMVDDFHGSLQWETFMESLRRVFPDREVVDIPEGHEVFSVLYDLDENAGRVGGQRTIRDTQIPGIFALMNGQSFEQDGVDPHWRGVFDDDGRLMVAINHNMDLGDAWEHADAPEYPQPLTALAYRVGINYVLYTMTH
jgi:hypothetical protein